MVSERPTKAYIDLKALAENYSTFTNLVGPEVSVMAVVKADAYGHGSTKCARALAHAGAEIFAVALPEEAVELRNSGIAQSVVTLGGFWPGQVDLVAEHNIIPVISSTDQLLELERALAGCVGRFAVHLKFDTGMGRAGFRDDDIANVVAILQNVRHLAVKGLMTHFAQAENTEGDAFTSLQIERFNRVVNEIRRAGHEPQMIDMANSPASIRHPDSYGNTVRIGGGLYGILDDIMPESDIAQALIPVMRLETEVTMTKVLKKGESVGYGRSFIADREMLTALLPIGYADGLPRQMSNSGKVLIKGEFAPLIGRVSMDWTVVDITDIEGIVAGDQAVIIGSSGDKRITAGDIGQLCDTIGYDVTCGISGRVPRYYHDD